MSILDLVVDAVNSGNWFIVFEVLTLNVTMLTMLLHLSKFCLGSSNFPNTAARDPASAEYALCLPM